MVFFFWNSYVRALVRIKWNVNKQAYTVDYSSVRVYEYVCVCLQNRVIIMSDCF